MAEQSKKSTNARDLIPYLLKNMNPRVKNELYIYYLQIAWNSIVGSQLTIHTMPVKINYTKLVIAVDHQGWSTQLAMFKDKILANIKKTLPFLNIKSLQFVTGKIIPEYRSLENNEQDYQINNKTKIDNIHQGSANNKSALNHLDKQEIADCLREINDDEFKNKFYNIFKNLKIADKKL